MRIAEAFCKMRLSEYCSAQDIDRAIAVTVDSFIGSQKVSAKRALSRAFAKYVPIPSINPSISIQSLISRYHSLSAKKNQMTNTIKQIHALPTKATIKTEGRHLSTGPLWHEKVAGDKVNRWIQWTEWARGLARFKLILMSWRLFFSFFAPNQPFHYTSLQYIQNVHIYISLPHLLFYLWTLIQLAWYGTLHITFCSGLRLRIWMRDDGISSFFMWRFMWFGFGV